MIYIPEIDKTNMTVKIGCNTYQMSEPVTRLMLGFRYEIDKAQDTIANAAKQIAIYTAQICDGYTSNIRLLKSYADDMAEADQKIDLMGRQIEAICSAGLIVKVEAK